MNTPAMFRSPPSPNCAIAWFTATCKTLLILVFAIARPVTGLIGMMFFDMHIGPFVQMVGWFGWEMMVGINCYDTAFAIITVSAWKKVP